MSNNVIMFPLTVPSELDMPETPTLAEIGEVIHQLHVQRGDWKQPHEAVTARACEVGTAAASLAQLPFAAQQDHRWIGQKIAIAMAALFDLARHFQLDVEACLAEFHRQRYSDIQLHD